MGMSFVVKYPEHPLLIEPMVRFAREELDHFQQVSRFALGRGLSLRSDEKDAYAVALHAHCRTPRAERLLDRLLVAALIEARSFERLSLVADHLEDAELKALYRRLTRAERRHKELFVDLASRIFPAPTVSSRLERLLDAEAVAIAAQPFGCRVH